MLRCGFVTYFVVLGCCFGFVACNVCFRLLFTCVHNCLCICVVMFAGICFDLLFCAFPVVDCLVLEYFG